MTPDQAYRKVLRIVGGAEPLAHLLGMTSQAVYLWKGVIPERQLGPVIAAMRRAIGIRCRDEKTLPTKEDLRPDLFPRNPKGVKNGKIKKEGSEAKEGGEANDDAKANAPR